MTEVTSWGIQGASVRVRCLKVFCWRRVFFIRAPFMIERGMGLGATQGAHVAGSSRAQAAMSL